MAEHQRHLHSKWPLLCGRPLPALLTPAGPTRLPGTPCPSPHRGCDPTQPSGLPSARRPSPPSGRPRRWEPASSVHWDLQAWGPHRAGSELAGERGRVPMELSATPGSSSRGKYKDRGPEGSRESHLLSPAPPPEPPPGIPQSLHLGLRDKDEALERRGPPISTGESQPPPGPANVRGTWSFRPSL